MIRINFTFDKTSSSLNFKKKILKKYKNYPIKKADCIVVAGGDGFMLQTIKKNYIFNKPFYGINCGSYGFLMNKLNYKDIFLKVEMLSTPALVRVSDINSKPLFILIPKQ